ncbi:PREDICTED: stAR-related lipid transfer protein 7, mitochondrial-like [Dufourea novaeangliae]|uniref:Phosphatidylcholine transfer protein n=1 Tax=Dufourea novaeangliae TaxID=178035 RepID=A0A154PFH4_DUFNO|nr:PREDICTED: stAR-related lipid transfer protein 7, mitochondrial-like [Dufourea novaeangliae]KZC10567.1 StAR-related lipid transfer protein 7, mitochondrial [Dufourea novaeangliae]
MYTVQFSGFLLKRFNTNYVQNGTRLASPFRHYGNYGKFHEHRKKISIWLKEHSGRVAEACVKQFEFIAAQRIRRSLQIFHLYTRIWDKVALRNFMTSWRNRALRNSRHYLMSTIGVTVYNWDRERISEQELNSYKQEIEGIYKLKDTTVVCSHCGLRIVIDVQQPGVKYCMCRDNKCNASSNQDLDGWRPYIEREDMLVWRREEPNSGGLFAYKVYGSFADVTAEDFLQAQIDVDYRKKWDPTARELRIIDTDPICKTTANDHTDVVYWETIWPRLFANRDYVYQRKWVVDTERRLIIIISKGTEHPSAPTKPGVYRVATYWSYMVIRPYTEFHQPGIEFGLTYFDNPGVNIPSAITAWVAMTGLPDFLIRMREASKNYQSYKQALDVFDVNYISLNEIDTFSEDNNEENCSPNLERNETQHGKVARKHNVVEQTETYTFTEDEQEEESCINEENNDSTSSIKEDRGFLDYFYLTKLFA